MAPKASKAAKSQSKTQDPPKEYPTIGAKLEAEYLASRPYLVLAETKGLSNFSAAEKSAYANSRFLETNAWRTWPEAQQKEFWKAIEAQRIPIPLPKPRDLGKDKTGKSISSYTPEEYKRHLKRERELDGLREKSAQFRETRKRIEEEGTCGKGFDKSIEEESNRRRVIGLMLGRKMGRYESDPNWDDVVPIPQDDGEGALAAIAYTDEYAEAMGYLRAVMASKEYSSRVLTLTEHIISMNAAHYTVWLYRASTLFAISSSIHAELTWVNDIALENQKNYQIWHHRQILIDNLYPTISSDPSSLQALADSETDFITRMFDEDAKNYHVWSYRQYLVKKLDLFVEGELKSIEKLLRSDVRNNSAWSHRFFVVFSDPKYCTPDSKATELDHKIPDEILDREIEFGKAATFEAPQNPSPWNYIRGVLRKGGRKLSTLDCFAEEFVKLPGEGVVEDVRSSHALDFLADAWTEEGKYEKADLALKLLGDKYDRIRKNYWDWRRGLLKEESVAKGVGGLDIAK